MTIGARLTTSTIVFLSRSFLCSLASIGREFWRFALSMRGSRRAERDVLAVLPVDARLAEEDAEIMLIYQLRCSSYIRNPFVFDEYVPVIGKFADYRLSAGMYPARNASRG